MRYNKQVANDAGLLRQYIVEHYGQVLTDGGYPDTMHRAMIQVRRLARLTGLGEDRVLLDIRNDYALQDCPDCGGNCTALMSAIQTSLKGGVQ